MTSKRPKTRAGDALIEQAMMERLLNVYLRESGGLDPDFVSRPAARELFVDLPNTGTVVRATLARVSLAGHHQFGERMFVARAGRAFRAITDAVELAHLLVYELAHRGQLDPAAGQELASSLLDQVERSVANTKLYSCWRAAHGGGAPAPGQFLAAEQGIVLGHPFHPAPKSAEGFLPGELERYAPELGASFQLHYFAVHPALLRDELPTGPFCGAIPEGVTQEARSRLPDGCQAWPLLPCHPWQDTYLRAQPEIAALVRQGQLRPLGALGAVVYPTSSVRTVWQPGHQTFLKLPLNVRVTNFVRVNTAEQVRRAMDATRALLAWSRRPASEECTVLMETGSRSVAVPADDERNAARLFASLAVVFREVPPLVPPPRVLAALLEPGVDGRSPEIARIVGRAARQRGQECGSRHVASWFRRYLEISFLPLLRLFLEAGISLEAHVQNTLLTTDSDWPAKVFIRDLEGAAISRERARHDGALAELDANSPALYDDEETWLRFVYHVVVNQLGHLISTLARYGPAPEVDLWRMVAGLVRELLPQFDSTKGAHYLKTLLSAPTLPAKANLTSRFLDRGETPLYVPVPNPISVSQS